MNSLTEEQTFALDCLIYYKNIDKVINENRTISVNNLVEKLQDNLNDQPDGARLDAAITKEEWQEVLNFIKNDDVLPTLIIDKNTYKNDPTTGFRAMAVSDPNKQYNTTVIFRGTQSDYQWHDNLSVVQGIAITPQQHMAKQYVMSLGEENLDLSGHSKGGNTTESSAYLLPDEIVNRAISFNGQRQSKEFLDAVPLSQRLIAESKTKSDNEARDIVSRIFMHNMNLDRTSYFISPESHLNISLYHRPNEFSLSDKILYENDIWPAGYLVDKLLDSLLSRKDIGVISKNAARIIWPDGWDDDYYQAVITADKIYLSMKEKRRDKLSTIYYEKILEYNSEHSDNSLLLDFFTSELNKDIEVVDGAVIYCEYGDGVGQLKLPISHGRYAREKPVLAATDTKAGINIIFEDNHCWGVSWNHLESIATNKQIKEKPPNTTEIPCVPETDAKEWRITDDNKTVQVEGEVFPVNVLLKRSVLYCNKGGIIYIYLSGQY